MKEHVRVLLLGDEGVGKSSLISAYVARHFPNEVPPVMADVTLPRESASDWVTVTIMDSSAHSSERDLLRKKILIADSFVVLHDVTRPETLDSVAQLWLPLIADVCNGVKKPTVVLGTKIDLLEDEQDLERAKSIMEQFSFVLYVLNSSAVRLDLDHVFFYGASLVTCPLFPIMDIATQDTTPAVRSAYLRIFRVYDVDGDGLWSDDELCTMQLDCFGTPLAARDVSKLKSLVRTTSVAGIASNKLTFEGFVALMKNTITEDLCLGIWTILRKFGYDDDLVLQIPKEVSSVPALPAGQLFELSDGAREFLMVLARNAYADHAKPIRPDSEDSEAEDCLTWEALRSIWAVFTIDEPTPWSNPPQCKMVWPENDDKIHPVAQSVLLTSLQHAGDSVSFQAWIAQWHALAMADPVRAQTLLFKLGYVNRADLGLVPSGGHVTKARDDYRALHSRRGLLSFLLGEPSPAAFRPRGAARVCVLGDSGVGKSSLVWYASDLTPPGTVELLGMEKGQTSEKAYESVVVGGSMIRTADTCGDSSATAHSAAVVAPSNGAASRANRQPSPAGHLCNPMCLVLTAVPMDHVYKYLKLSIQACDCALLVFQCGDQASLDTAWKLEQLLPDHIPRFYVAHKADLLLLQGAGHAARHGVDLDLIQRHEQVLESASLYAREHGLPLVHCTSTINGVGMAEVLHTVTDTLLRPELGQPRHFRERKPSLFASPSLYLATVGAVVLLGAVATNYHKVAWDWVRALLRGGAGRLALAD